MNFQANFTLRNKVDTEYLTGYFNHNGSLKQQISDKVQVGLSFFLNNDETSGDLVVEKLKMSYPFSIEDIFKGKIESNKLMSLSVEWQDKIRDYYDNNMTKNLNKFLVGRKTVEDLADYLNKATGLLTVYCWF